MERISRPDSRGDLREPETVRDLALREIDDSDKTFQFRLNEEAASLVQSLERDGQVTPIKVVAGPANYRIIDGFRRSAAARELGWDTIRALVYPPMLADEAKKIAFVANVVRRNLTVLEKANAIQMARQEGYSKADVAGMFGISQRQIERYLALPEEVLKMIDGREITMAHARILADQRAAMSPAEMAELVARIRHEHMSAPELQRYLTESGLTREPLGSPKTLGDITRDAVHIHRFELNRTASAERRAATAAFLRRALRQIEAFGTSEAGPRDIASESEA